MKILPIFVLLVVFNSVAFAQDCPKTAKEVKPTFSAETLKTYETKLAEAQMAYAATPNADSLIWLGRRAAYLGNYKEAIKFFTRGIKQFPKDARFYRHRGHRLITLRCFSDAVKDFEKAAKLIKGKADEIEPDGLPNAQNIPTSTLQTNIFYHLGLAYYLKGDFDNSLASFMACFKLSKNDDMRVAAAHWVYMGTRRFGKEKDAKKFIDEEIKDKLDIIENDDYYKLVQLYKGKLKAEELLKEIGGKTETLSNASLGYGLGNWNLYNGETEKALKIFRQIVAGNQWASFGYIAAEVEIKRMEMRTAKI